MKESNSPPPTSKSNPPPHIDRQNNIKILDFEFVDISTDHLSKPKDRLFDEACSICSSKIYYTKYICIVCLNCVLCENCESEHLHPVIKCKEPIISDIPSIYTYLTKNATTTRKTSKSFISSLFHASTTLKLSALNTSFTMRPNKQLKLSLRIENLSNSPLHSQTNNVYLISRNSRDLIIHDTKLTVDIGKKESVDCEVLIETNNVCKLHSFQLELYSDVLVFDANALAFKIEVNEDLGEEEYNEHFAAFPKILTLTKTQKERICYIHENYFTNQHPYIILSVLQENNWDVDKAVKALGKEGGELI
jgi:hypothetical protein